jgi:hypothetical protein
MPWSQVRRQAKQQQRSREKEQGWKEAKQTSVPTRKEKVKLDKVNSLTRSICYGVYVMILRLSTLLTICGCPLKS